MSPTLIDFLLCGLAYVLLSYFLGAWTKVQRKKSSGPDGGKGGKAETAPPVIDLPPGVTWPQQELVESE
ncbi:MAG: hypothetical protein ACO22X_01980 [Algoriphagus sp.]